jgi:hypothetical protein
MSGTHHAPSPPSGSRGPGYEQSDLPIKTITVALVLVGALLVLGLAAGLGVFDLLSERMAPGTPPAPPQATRSQGDLRPEPLLLVDAPKDLAAMRAEENKTLTTYAWTDREAGRVRIPIDRAMALLLERGLPRPAQPLKAPTEPPAKQPPPKPRGKARGKEGLG